MVNGRDVVNRITDEGLVAIVRAETSDAALKIADAIKLGGASCIEITFTVPGAAGVIQGLAAQYQSGDVLIGAGTVLDAETARVAILAGARYIVSPILSPSVIATCNRYGVPCLPGAMTVTEVVQAMELGAPLVKVFPGEVLGPSFIKAVRGPLPHAPMVPTGGVALDNVAEWIGAGAVALGVGGSLTAGSKRGDYAAVTEATRRFIAAIGEARAG